MKKIADFFYQKSTLIISIILTVVTFSYLFLVMIDFGKCFEVPESSTQSLGTSFGFDHETVVQFFSIRTEEMLVCYQEFNTIWDNIFALLYGFMYVSWVSVILKPYQEKVKFLNLLPFIQTLFDWLENFQLTRIAKSYLADGQVLSSSVELASAFSMIKWVVSMLVFIVIFIGIGLRIVDVVKRRKA